MSPHGMGRESLKLFPQQVFLDLFKSIGAGYGKTSLGYA